MKENWLKIFLKGLCVGGTMLVPGVSGGSMAMILGIYDKLITSVSSFFACKKRNALFLLLFALGGGAGMLLFANPLLYLLQRYPLVLRWFFIGAVAGALLPIDTTGIDFAMTALFIVIFTEQWLSYPTHLPAILGFICAVISLVIFGPSNFILPALIVTVTLLFVCRRYLEPFTKEEEQA